MRNLTSRLTSLAVPWWNLLACGFTCTGGPSCLEVTTAKIADPAATFTLTTSAFGVSPSMGNDPTRTIET